MKTKKRIPLWVTLTALTVGAVCILAGVLRGEAQTVYAKAVRICMECIGIG